MISIGELIKYSGILIGFVAVSYSLASLFIYAKNGMLQESIFMSLTAWIGYLLIHYCETGVLVDSKPDEKHIPESDSNWIIFAIASSLFVLGMVIGSNGVRTENVLKAFAGASILIGGYFAAHYELTDCLV